MLFKAWTVRGTSSSCPGHASGPVDGIQPAGIHFRSISSILSQFSRYLPAFTYPVPCSKAQLGCTQDFYVCNYLCYLFPLCLFYSPVTQHHPQPHRFTKTLVIRPLVFNSSPGKEMPPAKNHQHHHFLLALPKPDGGDAPRCSCSIA